MSIKKASLLFLVIGAIFFLVSFTGPSVPSQDELLIKQGVISSIDYRFGKNSKDMYIYFIDDPQGYLLRGFTGFNRFNGCTINGLERDDNITIYYEAGGYSDSIKETNGVWKIEKNNFLLIGMNDVKNAAKQTQEHIRTTGYLMLLAGVALWIISILFPNLEL